MNSTTRNILIMVGAVALIAIGLASVTLKEQATLDMAGFANKVIANEVKEVSVEGTKMTVTLTDDSKVTVNKESGLAVPELLQSYGVDADKARAIKTEVKQPSGASLWGSLLLQTLLPVLLIGVLMFFFFRQVQNQNNKAASFGQSTARELDPTKDKVTFKDVAGVREAKQELEEVVEFLKQPDKFSKLGAKIPKGVLLMGSPGTGKTLLARAVAGEADVPFLHMSGSEFVEMFVGVGASRVRDLFSKAKKSAPCIIFIDEIDAVGRQRGTGLGGSHDEREQTLNQILVEMDGFEPNLGVIVIAATNRADVLDPALLRPGRFDRRVILDPPDIRDREEMLTIHARNKPLAKDVNVRQLAERTPGFSGADLMNLMNEGAILAARQNKTEIGMMDLINSIEKVMLGPERKSHLMNEEERRVTAYHEAGHALVAHLSKNADPVHKVSIISRGRAAGYTIKLPTEDRAMRRKADYIDDIAVSLGGYAAEKLICGDLTTGASSDMQRVTQTARSMVTLWGMSDKLGPRTYGQSDEMVFLGREIHEARNYSESRAVTIDDEIDQLINEGLKTAEKIIADNRTAMDRIAEYLVKHETIEREQFEEVVGLPPANPNNKKKA
jgi:cell division protease FtsH